MENISPSDPGLSIITVPPDQAQIVTLGQHNTHYTKLSSSIGRIGKFLLH